MLYAIGKEDNKIHFTCSNKQNLDIMLKNANADINDYIILQEFGMEYVSRIVYVDEKCIYNNKEYWIKTAVENPLTPETYADHVVIDVMGNPVPYDRYVDELNNNINRLSSLDGTAGAVHYNMRVGAEIVSLLREECIDKGHGNASPNSMLDKASDIILALYVGCFREVIPLMDAMERDDFFTDERIEKYKAMVNAADVINYADDGETVFTASANA